jgi:hypothetical protein
VVEGIESRWSTSLQQMLPEDFAGWRRMRPATIASGWPASPTGLGSERPLGPTQRPEEAFVYGRRPQGVQRGGRGRPSDRIEVAATSFEFDPDEIRVAAGEDIAIVD